MRGLLAGAALAIHRGTGNGFRETGRQHSVAGNVESLFPGLSNAPRNDIVDEDRIEPVPFDKRLESVAEQVYGMPSFESAVSPSDRSANGIDNYSLAHVQARMILRPAAVVNTLPGEHRSTQGRDFGPLAPDTFGHPHSST